MRHFKTNEYKIVISSELLRRFMDNIYSVYRIYNDPQDATIIIKQATWEVQLSLLLF